MEHFNYYFSSFAAWSATQCGRSHTFVLAWCIILVWACLGPVFYFSDTWQLIINTGTTIITFLMVFLLQHTQTLDTLAIQAKLDELIRSNQQASNRLLNLEELSEEEIGRVRDFYRAIRRGDTSPNQLPETTP